MVTRGAVLEHQSDPFPRPCFPDSYSFDKIIVSIIYNYNLNTRKFEDPGFWGFGVLRFSVDFNSSSALFEEKGHC